MLSSWNLNMRHPSCSNVVHVNHLFVWPSWCCSQLNHQISQTNLTVYNIKVTFWLNKQNSNTEEFWITTIHKRCCGVVLSFVFFLYVHWNTFMTKIGALSLPCAFPLKTPSEIFSLTLIFQNLCRISNCHCLPWKCWEWKQDWFYKLPRT